MRMEHVIPNYDTESIRAIATHKDHLDQIAKEAIDFCYAKSRVGHFIVIFLRNYFK